MNTGDTYPVYLAGQVVADAKVVEFDSETATLIIPATRVVMAVRTELSAPEPVEPEVTGNEHVMLGTAAEAPGAVTAVPEAEVVQGVENPAPQTVAAAGQAQPNNDGTPTQSESAPPVEVVSSESVNTGVAGGTTGASETPQPQSDQNSLDTPKAE